MSIEDKNITSNINQNLILENREKLTITGVKDVLSFDDQIVILDTELGLLTAKGDNLKVNKLSIDTGDVILEGTIQSINYSKDGFDKKQSSFIGKLFK